MSYIIVAEFPEDRYPGATVRLLTVPEIRLLRRDSENEIVHLDIRGDFDHAAEQTRWLCNHLIDTGVINFSIYHSY